MSAKRNRAKASASPVEEVEPILGPEVFTHVAFVLTLALVAARAMMSETVRDPFDASASATPGPRGAGPAVSLILNSLAFVPALLVLLRRVADRRYVLRAGLSHLLLGAFALWAACSIGWASDRFAATIAASHTAASVALVWSTAQLVRSWLRLRIVAGLCVGLLLVYAAQGLNYRFIDHPDNVKFWNDNREQLLRERNMEPGSFAARQLEQKLVGGEMIGFHTSPNSFAAVIVLLSVITAGVAIQRRAARDGIAWTIAPALALLPALLVLTYTHTRTAAVTLLLAAALLASLASSRLRHWLAAHSRLAYTIGATLVLLGAIAVIGHGTYHGSLPGDSMTFRWRYWVASARLIADHPLVGVGWGTFGDHYTAVRLPIAAEEIRDPHNFVVRAFSELGLIGGALLLAWLARAAWELTRPRVSTTTTTATTGRGPLALALSAVVLGVLMNLGAAVDWTQPGDFLILETFRRVLAVGLLSGGMLLVALRGAGAAHPPLDDRPAPWLLWAVLAALGAFFLHALLDFVLAEPGPLMLFALVVGAALGIRAAPVDAGACQQRGRVIAASCVAVLAWIVFIVAHVIPIADAEQRAHAADDATRAGRPDLAAGLLRSAFQTVPSNGDYGFRAARALILAGRPVEEVKALIGAAIDANPRSLGYYRTRAELELRQPDPQPADVMADFDRAIALDPHGVALRLDYADALLKLGKPREAAQQYRLALDANARYHPDEPKRLAPDAVRSVEDKLRQLVAPATTQQG